MCVRLDFAPAGATRSKALYQSLTTYLVQPMIDPISRRAPVSKSGFFNVVEVNRVGGGRVRESGGERRIIDYVTTK